MFYSFKSNVLVQNKSCKVGRCGGQTDSAYRIVHAVGVGLFLGKETAWGIRRMGELGSVDEVIHWGTTTTSTASPSSSHAPCGGVPMREVKVPLDVIVVAFRDKRTFEGFF